jgi:hypothetical protein
MYGDWTQFYKQFLGVDVDMQEVPPVTPGLHQLELVIAPGLIVPSLLSAMRALMTLAIQSELEAELMDWPGRGGDQPIVYLTEDSLEVPLGHRSNAAQRIVQLPQVGWQLMGLRERLLLELWQKFHNAASLDCNSVTMCPTHMLSGDRIVTVCTRDHKLIIATVGKEVAQRQLGYRRLVTPR